MDITMPQLGETVTEGTITRWFKQVGEAVAADEPLFEVSTDKVDSEVPAPSAGVLTEIIVPEGETVAVGARLAVIGDGSAVVAAAPAPAAPETPAPPAPPAPVAVAPAPAPEPAPAPAPVPAPAAPSAVAPAPVVPAAPAAPSAPAAAVPAGTVASPLVRRLIAEYGLDPATIPATGDGGRITRNDVLAVAQGRGAGAPAAPSAPSAPAPAAPALQPSAEVAPAAQLGDTVVPFDNIRRRTAEHMVRSKATSAHVYTAIEVDFERVERIRRSHGAAFRAEEGFSLTYLPFVCRAVCDLVHEYPHVNASIDGESLVVHRDLHLGIAVDLDFHGLVAPVVRNADGKRLRLIAREIRDLASRAKTKQLRPDEVLGGTFTITNMGPTGTTITLPIINQPQVAILAADGVAKKPVVIEGPDGEDTIAIHHVGMVALAWDHRAFDGAYAGSFLRDLKAYLEHHDWESELA